MVPDKYANHYMPVKYFLSSYRALCDGRRGVEQLERRVETTETFFLSDWKVIWIGTCTILRTAIDLFRVDGKSCLAPRIKEEINAEWKSIDHHKSDHPIFWEFLRAERNNILHEYQWQAYEAWMKPDGTFRAPQFSLMILEDDGARPMLLMRDGHFKGQNSLELLKEGANWVEDRIFDAIRRAGFDPEENRGLVHFEARPKLTDGLMNYRNNTNT